MSDDQLYSVFLGLMLILPISALAARRLPISTTIKMILAWIAIFGILFLLVALWQQAVGVGSNLAAIVQ